MERDDRPPVAAFYVPALAAAGAAGTVVVLPDGAAHHARVKRLSVGDPVRLTDGAGGIAAGTLASIDKRGASVAVESCAGVAAPPALHLRVPVGDRDRMLLLAEKAAEFGVTSWQAVRFRRSLSVSPRGEGDAFAARVEARMISALEQSGGAWLPRRLADCGVESVDDGGIAQRLLLDRDAPALLTLAPHGPAAIVLGPEGGLEPGERDALVAAGWHPARLAETTLRFETAGIGAIAVVRAAQLAHSVAV